VNPPHTDTLIDLALQEDAGFGDLTSRAVFTREHRCSAVIEARQDLIVCGLSVAARVFERVDSRIRARALVSDGDLVGSGKVVMRLSGPTASILMVERTALNFLQHLCGIATLARYYCGAVKGSGVRIVDTRKTMPGFRALEKYAVRCGGCFNHRSSLGEHVLIKDNHIDAAGSLERAVKACRLAAPHSARIEVEARTLSDVRKACNCGADVILLDNMTVGEVKAAVAIIDGRAIVEVSGGIRLDTVRKFALPGVSVISVGGITHSAPAADLSLEVKPRRARR
jgi:nicotinate-nucleotide pyrophosphorylase (carboxylating)